MTGVIGLTKLQKLAPNGEERLKIEDRPTEMLERQMLANRQAARKRKHFAHILPYRPFFVLEMLLMKAELKKRRHASHTA